MRVRSLLQDTWNFFLHQSSNIIFIAVIISCCGQLAIYLLMPNLNDFPQIEINSISSTIKATEDITNHQKNLLAATLMTSTVINLVSNSLLVGATLKLISAITAKKHINPVKAILESFHLFPQLILLVFLIYVVVQLGLFLFIIPGFILASFLSLSPVLLVRRNMSTFVFSAMRQSVSLTYRKMNLVLPAILAWFMSKILVLLLHILLISYSLIMLTPLLGIISYMMSSILIIYLYRLNMLSSENSQ